MQGTRPRSRMRRLVARFIGRAVEPEPETPSLRELWSTPPPAPASDSSPPPPPTPVAEPEPTLRPTPIAVAAPVTPAAPPPEVRNTVDLPSPPAPPAPAPSPTASPVIASTVITSTVITSTPPAAPPPVPLSERVLDVSKQLELQAVLQDLHASADGVTGAVLASRDGLAIVSTMQESQTPRVAAMAATIVALAQQAVPDSEPGGQTVIRGTGGCVVVYGAGPECVLAVQTTARPNIGLVQIEAPRAAEELAQLLAS